MGKLHGKNGAIYINGSKVANKTEWMLSMIREYADVTTFRDKNKVNAAGLMDISGTFAGLLDTDGDALITKNDGTPYTVALYAEDQVTLVASGPAFVDAAVTVTNADAVRINGNFKAAGDWTITGLTV
jgi:uncharacterized protein (DUF2141 family)